jgi:hypothetical protein
MGVDLGLKKSSFLRLEPGMSCKKMNDTNNSTSMRCIEKLVGQISDLADTYRTIVLLSALQRV